MRRRKPCSRAARSSSRRLGVSASRRRRVRWPVPSHRRGPCRSRSRRRSASCLARCAGATGTRTVRLWVGLSRLWLGSRRWGRRSLGRPGPGSRPPAAPPAGRLRSTESSPRRSGRFRGEGYVLRSVDDCSGNHADQAVKCAARPPREVNIGYGRNMTTTKITMHPGAEREVAPVVLSAANDAAAAVGPAAGRTAEEIVAQLKNELTTRGMDLPTETLNNAAAEILAGNPFEFSGGL